MDKTLEYVLSRRSKAVHAAGQCHVIASFPPGGGASFVVAPRKAETVRMQFVSAVVPALFTLGPILVTYRLQVPLPVRVLTCTLALSDLTTGFAPFVPLPIGIDDATNVGGLSSAPDMLQVLIPATDPGIPGPGAPDITLQLHMVLWDPARLSP